MVVTIVGILFAISLPIYRDYVITASRGAAKSVLLEIVSREEQYAASNRAYYATPAANDLSGLGMTVPSDISNRYDFSITLSNVLGTNDGFIALATAKGDQATDGNLQINQFGLKTPTGRW